MTIYAIDNWEAADQIDFQIDGENITYNGLNSSIFPSNLCGGYSKDMTLTLYFKIAHALPDLNFTMTSVMTQASTDRSFGMRHLEINFLDLVQETTPNACSHSGYDDSALQCCPDGDYLFERACRSCSVGCKRCLGDAAIDCTSCLDGYYYDGSVC